MSSSTTINNLTTMITAKNLRSLSENAVKNTNAANIEFTLAEIEKKIKTAAESGLTSYSANVDMMMPGITKPTAAYRRAISMKLKDLGYSYEEFKSGNSIWFTITW